MALIEWRDDNIAEFVAVITRTGCDAIVKDADVLVWVVGLDGQPNVGIQDTHGLLLV